MTKYTATARREGRWWLVQCDQHPGALSQVSRLDQANEVHREAIAFVADVALESVEIQVNPEIDPVVSEELDEADRLRAEAAESEKKASELRTRAAQRLKRSGLTVRDVGLVLGVNYQRAAKLSQGQTAIRKWTNKRTTRRSSKAS